MVEIDGTEIPCRSKNDPVTGGGGRSRQAKMLIVGVVEVQDGGAGPGRIRLNKVSDYSADSLHPFIAGNPHARRHRQDRRPVRLSRCFPRQTRPHIVGKMAAHIVLPWVHSIFSNLKVWALGVYHGLRRKDLECYIDECVFRFNRRRSRHTAFRSLLGITAGHAPLSYNMLIAPEAKSYALDGEQTPRLSLLAMHALILQKHLEFFYCRFDSLKGLPKSTEAASWYRRAAEAGHTAAARALGSLYLTGAGVAQDGDEAARWLRVSGEAGDRTSQTDLANLVLEGAGAPEDPARVAQWFEQAAAGDLVPAFNFGICQDKGVGVRAR